MWVHSCYCRHYFKLQSTSTTGGQEQSLLRSFVISSPSSHQCSTHGSLGSVHFRTKSYTSRTIANDWMLCTYLLHEPKWPTKPNKTATHYTVLSLLKLVSKSLKMLNSQCSWTFRIRCTSCNTAQQLNLNTFCTNNARALRIVKQYYCYIIDDKRASPKVMVLCLETNISNIITQKRKTTNKLWPVT